MHLGGIIYEGDTAFNHYSVQDMLYLGRPARVLFSGANQAAQSGMALDGKDGLLFDYNQRFLDIVRGVRPQSILVLGGGAFTLPTALRQEFPDIQITIVEIDEQLVDIARYYFEFKPNDRVAVVIDDARHFLERSSQTFDIIIVDVFQHDAVPDTFQTLAAVQIMRQNLNRHGVLAMNIIASLEGRRSPLLYRMQEHMQAVFPRVDIFPAKRDLSPWIAQNYIAVAHDGSHNISAYLGYGAVGL